MNLFLCESEGQVAAARQIRDPLAPDTKIVALTPEVASACQSQHLPYLKLESFFNQPDFYAHRKDVLRETYQWIDQMDAYIKNQVPSLRATTFAAASTNANTFQQSFDELFSSSYALKSLFKQHPDASLWYWPPAIHPHQDVLSYKASFIPHLMRTMGATFHGEIHPIEETLRSAPAVQRKSNLRLTVINALTRFGVMGTLAQIRHAGLRRYANSMFKSRSASDRLVLVLGSGYDLDPLVLALRELGHKTHWIQSSRELQAPVNREVRIQLTRLWTSLLNQDHFWAPLTQWGIGRSEFFASLIRFWWDYALPDQCEMYAFSEEFLKQANYQSIISSETGSGSFTSAMFQAAKHHNIPRVLYQHGSTIRWDSVTGFGSLCQIDAALVYGESIVTQVNNTWPRDIRKDSPALVPVGSARFDSIRASASASGAQSLRSKIRNGDPRPLILYVPIFFGSLGGGLSDLAGYNMISYFEMQQDVLKVFSEFPHVRLIYKEMTTTQSLQNPIGEFLRANVPNATRLQRPNLTRLVWAVDAIIVDHCVTALGEALLTSKPLLVYDPGKIGSIPELPEARALLRKRATVSETPEDFTRDIRGFLREGNFSDLASPNNECLARYGTHLNDGHSAQRAAAYVSSLSSHSLMR